MIIANSDMFTVTHISVDCDDTDIVPFKLLSDVARDYQVIYVLGNHEEGKDGFYMNVSVVFGDGDVSRFNNQLEIYLIVYKKAKDTQIEYSQL